MSKNFPSQSDIFRQTLQTHPLIEVPGCYDAFTAMVVEQVGYPSLFISGNCIAASVLGNPDIGLTSLVETSFVVKNVVKVVDIPVIVDIDDGYGDEHHVARTIYEMERAGAAGVILEDLVSNKPCGQLNEKKILPLKDYMKKLERALHCRETNLCVVARTDESDVDKAIQRCKTYHQAGSDLTFIQGIGCLDALKKIGEHVPGRKILNIILGGKTPILSATEYEKLGFQVILYPTMPLYVAGYALFKQMQQLKNTQILSSIEDSLHQQEFQNFIIERFLKRK
jgi:methylisocitrate lyase